MLHIFILLISGITYRTFAQSDSILRWSADRKLTYGDFLGQCETAEVSHNNFDTIASIRCSIKYDFNIKDGKRIIHAYAYVDPKKSWMDEKNSYVLNHKQGHFDIAEIFARRLEKAVNDTTVADIHNYLVYLNETFGQAIESLHEEQIKYDNYTLNTLGKEYYDKWISEQLNGQPK
jgi:hypothetical protein